MKPNIHIALDLGGTKLIAAAITPDRDIITRERANTPKSFQEGLTLLKALAHKVSSNTNILSIGLSTGGPLDYMTGVISPLHFPEWRDVPLKQIMEDEFQAPFSVDVDTNAAALAEYKFGGLDTESLLYITLSTGMGGGLIVNGEIFRGANGSHPEVAHQAIPYRLPISGPIQCLCGATDCLEAIVCGSAIKKIYKKGAEDLLPEEWDQVAYNLGQGLRNMAAVYAPAVIVLGGGMALGGGERLLDGARSVVQNNLKIVPVPEIRFSELGYDSALWGAFALAVDTPAKKTSES